jgi:hypothetical protein
LRRHKEQWLEICDNHPEIFIGPARYSDVGPVQALIDELEFNERVAERLNRTELGCLFHNEQFRRAVAAGSIALLQDELKNAVVAAYVEMGAANQVIESAWRHPPNSAAWAEGSNDAQRRVREAGPKIAAARKNLMRFLGSDSP